MSLKNQLVYIQFHPVAYMVKLNIEMSMANLITKLAQNSIEARNNEFMVESSSHNHSRFQNTHQSNAAIGMQSGVNASAVSKKRNVGDETQDIDAIRTLKEVKVTVENLRAPGETSWRKSESDSGVEDGFGRKQARKIGSEDELPLAPVPKKGVEWKN
ncbi:hypothetical protein ACEPPN_009274 [Leptodophora sp. 'Broadleaf-Isolate-01']